MAVVAAAAAEAAAARLKTTSAVWTLGNGGKLAKRRHFWKSLLEFTGVKVLTRSGEFIGPSPDNRRPAARGNSCPCGGAPARVARREVDRSANPLDLRISIAAFSH